MADIGRLLRSHVVFRSRASPLGRRDPESVLPLTPVAAATSERTSRGCRHSMAQRIRHLGTILGLRSQGMILVLCSQGTILGLCSQGTIPGLCSQKISRGGRRGSRRGSRDRNRLPSFRRVYKLEFPTPISNLQV